jgi:hypothetical protein
VQSADNTEQSAGAPTLPTSQQPFQWGPITLHPHLSYEFTYGNGLQSSPGNQHKSAINAISPGIGIELGRHWQLDYTPTITLYSDKAFRNVVDQSIQLNGATAYQDWLLKLAQSVSLTEDPQTSTATQVQQQNYDTTFDARVLLNSENSLDFNLAQKFQLAQNLQNSREWSVMNWLDHHWGPNVGFGGGVGGGYVNVETGSDMSYETLQARVFWRVAQKINLAINGGGQIRQFLGSSQPSLVSPIYGVSISYQPTETTTLSISASRNVSVSYFDNQVTDASSFNATVSQRLFKSYFLGLSGGYSYTRYLPSSSTVTVTRVDEYYFVSVSLGTSFLKRGSASVFYTFSSNSSNAGQFAYSSDQIGLNISYHY